MIREVFLLSTCNRVEILLTTPDAPAAVAAAKTYLSATKQIPVADFESALYVHYGDEAVRHIFRVAASLDSMVVGEPQILGQMKSAYQMATESKVSGLVMHRLLHRAFHVAKRVRTETKIGNSAVSISSVAVELAQKIFGTLGEKTVLLIGAGEMCELAARHLVFGGVGKVMVTNRTFERAVAFAQEFKGEALPFDEITQGLKKVDIVISATDSRQPLIRHVEVAKVIKERKQKPIFFIDIADPRNVEPSVGNIENVYLYNIDDLKKVADENIQDREKEARKAETIVKEEVVQFTNWYRSLEVIPTLTALRTKFEEIRKKELEKTFSLHPHLSDKEKRSLEALTQAIINKILHPPMTLLKQPNEEAMADLYVDALRTLFQLPEASPENLDVTKEKENGDAGI